MPIAEHPLHRSGRAALPHPAPTWGDDAQAHEGIGMTDVRGRQPPGKQGLHTTPGQVIALTATTQHPPPQATDRETEGTDRGTVHRHAVVTDVTENNRTQIGAHGLDGFVQAMPELGFDLSQLPLPPRTHRLAQHREPALTCLPATMREAKEVEGLRCSSATAILSVFPRMAAELDQSRLLGVQLQAKAREPLTQLGEEPLGLDSMLEPDDEVVRETHYDDIAARLLPSPSLDPQVEHVVQVDIGQEGLTLPP